MKNQFSIFCNAAKKTIFPFFFAGDVKPSDISASNEDIITALEALSGSSSSKNRKSPRPTSVPFNKSFLSDTTAKVRAAGGLYSTLKYLITVPIVKILFYGLQKRTILCC